MKPKPVTGASLKANLTAAKKDPLGDIKIKLLEKLGGTVRDLELDVSLTGRNIIIYGSTATYRAKELAEWHLRELVLERNLRKGDLQKGALKEGPLQGSDDLVISDHLDALVRNYIEVLP